MWTRTENPNIYSAFVESGRAKPRDPSSWSPPGLPLGRVWFAWPKAPDEKALAYKVSEWLLILEGRQKAKYEITVGPALGMVPSIQFETAHNGIGGCTMALIYDAV
jgi:hypothetical protein